ncbi:MAG: hypothetical protein Kow00124_28290 [Anaerolineae bacterium]
MKKEWRIPLALVTADVVALALSLVVMIVLFAATQPFSRALMDGFTYGSFTLAAALIMAWLVVSWRRIRAPEGRERLIARPRELALASLGMLFGGAWLATAGGLMPVMSGLVIPTFSWGWCLRRGSLC